MEANKERQIEEIEALTSIYEDLFELENENNYTGVFRFEKIYFYLHFSYEVLELLHHSINKILE